MVEEKNRKEKSWLLITAEKKLNFQLPGTPYTIVSNGALNYVASERIRSLSQPRVRKPFNHTRAGKIKKFRIFPPYFNYLFKKI